MKIPIGYVDERNSIALSSHIHYFHAFTDEMHVWCNRKNRKITRCRKLRFEVFDGIGRDDKRTIYQRYAAVIKDRCQSNFPNARIVFCKEKIERRLLPQSNCIRWEVHLHHNVSVGINFYAHAFRE